MVCRARSAQGGEARSGEPPASQDRAYGRSSRGFQPAVRGDATIPAETRHPFTLSPCHLVTLSVELLRALHPLLQVLLLRVQRRPGVDDGGGAALGGLDQLG